ncbi:MAG: right-handed parallel beta-helix repeat-containing protein [Spirochaetes bacterium]|nr:right-handed parallel beta-helix repeat-containing protein [Spirochaetota bacterium]
MRNAHLTILAAIALFALASLPASAASVYSVDPAGSDAGPGTAARPWKTIGRAAAAIEPGDTVLIAAGTYRERVRVERSGAPGKPCTFAARPGAQPIIDGRGIPVAKDEGLFEISGASHIRVIGLHVVNSAQAGIIAENSSDLVIQGNHTERTGSSGISAWGCRDVLVDGNEVAHSCSDMWQEGISIAGTKGFEVRNNLVYNGLPGHKKEGICLKDGSSDGRVHGNRVHHVTAVGIYVDAWDKHTFDIDVYGNDVHDILDSGGIMLASEMGGLLERIRIFNNVSWRNRYCGIVISQNGEKVPHPMRDIWIVNNTVHGNGTGEWGGGILADNPGLQSAVIRNNICSRNLTFEIAVGYSQDSAVTIDHNLSDGEHEDPSSRMGQFPVTGNPVFVAAVTGDFRLSPGSPAIDKGSAAGAPKDDFDGAPRPRGAGIDIGAYER